MIIEKLNHEEKMTRMQDDKEIKMSSVSVIPTIYEALDKISFRIPWLLKPSTCWY